jgi:ubiquitin
VALDPAHIEPTAIDDFIARWQHADGTERANYQLFLTELAELLQLPRPQPAASDWRDNAYVFERVVDREKLNGAVTKNWIDLYRRDAFVCEAKRTNKSTESRGFDTAIQKAFNQAESYARALPAAEGRPPFILIADVGQCIDIYAEFTRSGGHYTPFPDSRSHRIRLADLRQTEIRERLRAIWLDPIGLDPARRSARVTRQIADKLARLAKSLEADGHGAEQVAAFLMRALFTMFAEDVGLLPERAFTEMLDGLVTDEHNFAAMVTHLWQTMNTGGFHPLLKHNVLRFNGGLFADATAIPLKRDQIGLLGEAAQADWRHVEPAIFGTLLERALDARERHKLGAHYTPRAYVERLVLPTVIEPLRAEWQNVQAAAVKFEREGLHRKAIDEIKAFQQRLCQIRVLDPACGSGNFLYVTLEHMKRLEGEVLNLLHELGESQGLLDLAGVTVDPHQFLGLEINPRAARIAEMVLWIGYLQWHFRTQGHVQPPQPVLKDFHNIEHRDALITYAREELVCDPSGQPLTRWDGITTRPSPVTGEPVPDESAQVEQYRYLDPRKAEWPQADFIVGNPPFIGCKRMRTALGDGYVDAVRNTWPEVPESADFVMYWWHIAAETVRAGKARRFGFITTNSIRQTFNRRVIQAQLDAKKPLALAFAIPDHPWVDAADGAAVRIAMTVGTGESIEGRLLQVRQEEETDNDEVAVNLAERSGTLFADLSIGADVAGAKALSANAGISSPGVKLHGAGFIVTPDEAAHLGLGTVPGLEAHIRAYRNGRDLTDRPRGVMVIDLFGLEADDVRMRFPAVYQWVVDRVRPERAHNHRPHYRDNWWLFGEPRRDWRAMVSQIDAFVSTPVTAKHRLFQVLSSEILPDDALICIASHDLFLLGVLSSRIHVLWTLVAGSTLENRPRYIKSSCLDTFPFPDASIPIRAHISGLAAEIDAHRKRQQAAHPGLTLTGMYNVLEKLRAGEPLSAKDKTLHEQGLVSVLRELHDALDTAVFEAYGWADLGAVLVGRPGATTPLPDKPAEQAEAEEALLCRLVALNAERAAEEAAGTVRWLRPDYQAPEATTAPIGTRQQDLAIPAPAAKDTGKPAWPKLMREQVAAVRAVLAGKQLSAEAVAAHFKRKPLAGVTDVLDTLEAMGLVSREEALYRA